MFALVGLAGLAIDTANLMHARRVFQNALNSAAMAGARFALSSPLSQSTMGDVAQFNDELTANMREIVKQNMEANGFQVGESGRVFDAIESLLITHGEENDAITEDNRISDERDWVRIEGKLSLDLYLLNAVITPEIEAHALAKTMTYDIGLAMDVWGPARWVKFHGDDMRPPGCAGNWAGQGASFGAQDCHVGLDMVRYTAGMVRRLLVPRDKVALVVAGGSDLLSPPPGAGQPKSSVSWVDDCKYFNATESPGAEKWLQCGVNDVDGTPTSAFFPPNVPSSKPGFNYALDYAINQISEANISEFDAGWSDYIPTCSNPNPVCKPNSTKGDDWNNPAAALWGVRTALQKINPGGEKRNVRRVIIFISPGSSGTHDGNAKSDGVPVPGGPNALSGGFDPVHDLNCPAEQRDMLDQTKLSTNVYWPLPASCPVPTVTVPSGGSAPSGSPEGNERRRRQRMLEMIHEGDLARDNPNPPNGHFSAKATILAIYPDPSSDSMWPGNNISYYDPNMDMRTDCTPFQDPRRWPRYGGNSAANQTVFNFVKPLALIRTANDKSQIYTPPLAVPSPYPTWDFPCVPEGRTLRQDVSTYTDQNPGYGGRAWIGRASQTKTAGRDFEDKFSEMLHALDAGRVWLAE
ncbi:MAG: Tad domain-containing protein [Oligoflexia bacterium]|nr:Tad domain-containing protein [Oligoflexia bacterium]